MAVIATPQTLAFPAALGYVSSYTFSAAPIGSVSSDRLLVFSVCTNVASGQSQAIANIVVKIDADIGVSLNKVIADPAANYQRAEIWVGHVPDSITTADVVVYADYTFTLNDLGLGIEVLTGADAIFSAAVSDTGSVYRTGGVEQAASASLTVPADGVGIGVGASISNAPSPVVDPNAGTASINICQTSGNYSALGVATLSASATPAFHMDSGGCISVVGASFAPYATSIIGTNLIPRMTGATTSGVTMSSGPSTAAATHEAYRVGDCQWGTPTYFESGTSSFTDGAVTNGTGEWLQIDFGTAASKQIRQYSLTAAVNFGVSPISWTVLGSNTGSFGGEETVIDTQTNVAAWVGAHEKRTFKLGTTSAGFRYYRLNVTAVAAGNTTMRLGEFELDGEDATGGVVNITIGSQVADMGLTALTTDCDGIYITSQEPTDYTDATSTHAVGRKLYTRGTAFGSPAAGTGGGRKVSSSPITDGAIIADSATETHWVAVDSTNSRILAYGALSGSTSVTNGRSFTLDAITVHLPNN